MKLVKEIHKSANTTALWQPNFDPQPYLSFEETFWFPLGQRPIFQKGCKFSDRLPTTFFSQVRDISRMLA